MVVAHAGNCSRHDAALNTAGVVALTGTGWEVVLGPDRALSGEPYRSDEFHGADGVGGARALLPAASPPHHLGTVTGDVVATGPLTPVAPALGAVGALTWMGGAVRRAGNVTPHAEFNAWWDAAATAAVLGSGRPVQVLPLDVTTTIEIGHTEIERLATGSGRTARWCAAAGGYTVRRNGGMFLHDPAAVLASVRPELFTWEDLTLAGIAEGEQAGATRVVAEGGPHWVAVAADVPAVVEAILTAILSCP
jgi:inosine-uridine nucleoside N-ribohydrolase